MAHSASPTHALRDVLATVSGIPAGYVTTHGDLGRHLGVQSRHVSHILATLDEGNRALHPWWRVVADGGAVGRHQHRDDQIARLKADGVPLSGAGIVQELKDRRIADLASLPTLPFPTAPTTPSGAPARSRGMKSHPGG